MLDANILMANSANISANGNSAIFDIGPSGHDGAWFELATVGAVTGTTPTLTVTVQVSDSPTFASGVRTVGVMAIGTGVFNAQGQKDCILCQFEERYVRFNYVVTGTTPVFNGCIGGQCSGPQRDDIN